ncbi:hypothetical protein GNY06_04495 [Elizabethkingia argentiflava]|uniref:Uncharacterized protein n=1 Tax=Elizabethkingia argenteiflava TaxID=2681556 RepID=A0A845PUB3_9FLAO|nr:hypothetical protein [Elizabethkingia argenteiflava]NAW50673.1 hypothetical protein [Elizabethkingia argenteiflava]
MKALLKILVSKNVVVLMILLGMLCFGYYFYNYKTRAKKMIINVSSEYSGYIVIFFDQNKDNVKSKFRFPTHYVDIPKNGIIRTHLKASQTFDCDIKINGKEVRNYSLHLNDGTVKDKHTFGIYIDEYVAGEGKGNVESNFKEKYSVILLGKRSDVDSIRYPDPSMIERMYKYNVSGEIKNWIKKKR